MMALTWPWSLGGGGDQIGSEMSLVGVAGTCKLGLKVGGGHAA